MDKIDEEKHPILKQFVKVTNDKLSGDRDSDDSDDYFN
jgi:hypothetical protein